MSSWNAGATAPSRTARWATTAERLPPALSPPTAMRVGIDADAGGVGVHPRPGGPDVVDRGGERVLRREPVVDGDHPHLRLLGQDAAERVVAVEVAVHEAAAVDEHEGRRSSGDAPAACRTAGRWDRPDRRCVRSVTAPIGCLPPTRRAEATTCFRALAMGRVSTRRALERLEPEHQLHLDVERLAVDDDRLAGETLEDRARKREESPGRALRAPLMTSSITAMARR